MVGGRFRVRGWSAGPYFVLINSLRDEPTVRVNGQEPPLRPPHQYSAADGFVVLQIEGTKEVDMGSWSSRHRVDAEILLDNPRVGQ